MWGGPPYRRVAPHRQSSKQRVYGRDGPRMRFFIERKVIRQVNLWSRLNKGFTPIPVALRPVGTSRRDSAGGPALLHPARSAGPTNGGHIATCW